MGLASSAYPCNVRGDAGEAGDGAVSQTLVARHMPATLVPRGILLSRGHPVTLASTPPLVHLFVFLIEGVIRVSVKREGGAGVRDDVIVILPGAVLISTCLPGLVVVPRVGLV